MQIMHESRDGRGRTAQEPKSRSNYLPTPLPKGEGLKLRVPSPWGEGQDEGC